MTLLYSNENFPQPVVFELRRLGHDVLTVFEAGNAEQAIEEDKVLLFATQLRRAVITLNRKHFIRLHHIQTNHAGIIVCTYDPNILEQAARIHATIQPIADLTGQLIRVNRSN